jgi:polar amino acid transport system substrate-binding protein
MAIAGVLLAGCGAPVEPSPSVSPAPTGRSPIPLITPSPTPVPPATPTPSPAATPTPPTTPSPTPAPVACNPDHPALVTPGRLTIATPDSAFPPWFGGDPDTAYPGQPATGPTWQFGNPYSQQGYESALGYAIASRLGFDSSSVIWVAANEEQATAPGAKPFDLFLGEHVVTPTVAASVAQSNSYYDLNQALIALSSNSIAERTSVSSLRTYRLGALAGESMDTINAKIIPTRTPRAYTSIAAASDAVLFGQIDGLVTDLPTALSLYYTELAGSIVVGQFHETSASQFFAAVLPLDSPLTGCVNDALAGLRGDGTLDQARQTWLVLLGGVPYFSEP